MVYDVLIPAAEKDFVKLRFVWESIIENLTGFDKIYCISNVEMPQSMKLPAVEYYTDADVVDFDFMRLTGNMKSHEGWYVQQYVKLFQNVTSDNYLEVDADVFFNRRVDIIENDKPTFLFGGNQYHAPYFNLMKNLFNLDKVYPYSFINETMFFKREIINHLLASIGVDRNGFFELVLNEVNRVNQMSGFSEYELYGNYVTKNFVDLYNYKYLKTHPEGKDRVWKEDEVCEYVNSFKETDYDLISMHSWITA
jgi:hypothetical protein